MDSFQLSQQQVDHFVEYGFVHLTDCFDRNFAERWTSEAFVRLGYEPEDPTTWQHSFVHLPNESWVPVKDFAPKAYSAICQLLGGEERIQDNLVWGTA